MPQADEEINSQALLESANSRILTTAESVLEPSEAAQKLESELVDNSPSNFESINGRYRLERHVSEGEHFTVYDALDLLENRRVRLVVAAVDSQEKLKQQALQIARKYDERAKGSVLDFGTVAGKDKQFFVSLSPPKTQSNRKRLNYWAIGGSALIIFTLVLMPNAFNPSILLKTRLFFEQLRTHKSNLHSYGMIKAQWLLLKDLSESWRPIRGVRSTVYAQLTYDGQGKLMKYSISGSNKDQNAGQAAIASIAQTPLRLGKHVPSLKQAEILVRFDTLSRKDNDKHICIWLRRINDQYWETAEQPFEYSEKCLSKEFQSPPTEERKVCLTGYNLCFCDEGRPLSFFGTYVGRLDELGDPSPLEETWFQGVGSSSGGSTSGEHGHCDNDLGN